MLVSTGVFHYFAYKEFTSEQYYGSMWKPKRMPTRQFKSLFKLTPVMCKLLWNRMDGECHTGQMPFHQVYQLLYALHYLKTRATFDNIAARTGHDEKTIRKWTWIVIEFIANKSWVCT
jgi:hypothetical protein